MAASVTATSVFPAPPNPEPTVMTPDLSEGSRMPATVWRRHSAVFSRLARSFLPGGTTTPCRSARRDMAPLTPSLAGAGPPGPAASQVARSLPGNSVHHAPSSSEYSDIAFLQPPGWRSRTNRPAPRRIYQPGPGPIIPPPAIKSSRTGDLAVPAGDICTAGRIICGTVVPFRHRDLNIHTDHTRHSPREPSPSSPRHGAAYALQQAKRATLGCREAICTTLRRSAPADGTRSGPGARETRVTSDGGPAAGPGTPPPAKTSIPRLARPGIPRPLLARRGAGPPSARRVPILAAACVLVGVGLIVAWLGQRAEAVAQARPGITWSVSAASNKVTIRLTPGNGPSASHIVAGSRIVVSES